MLSYPQKEITSAANGLAAESTSEEINLTNAS
jgi:hypothetical protein